MRKLYRTSPFRNHFFAFLGYLGCGMSGLMVVLGEPSRSLQEHGRIFVIIWSLLYVAGSLLAVTGLILKRILIEIIGAGISGLVSFVWAASLAIQAMATGTTVPLTAAFVATSLAGLLAQRWTDASQRYTTTR